MLLEAGCSAASTLLSRMAGDVGHGEMRRAVERVEGKLSGGEGGEELIKSSKVL
jgi:hypothetical protein